MQARPTTLALGEAAEALLNHHATIGSMVVYNESTDTIVYLKIWAGLDEAPNVATTAADYVFPIPPAGQSVVPLFAQINGPSWWAATNEIGAGATAPDADLTVTATYERVSA